MKHVAKRKEKNVNYIGSFYYIAVCVIGILED